MILSNQNDKALKETNEDNKRLKELPNSWVGINFL
jgi:hypothetical protein